MAPLYLFQREVWIQLSDMVHNIGVCPITRLWCYAAYLCALPQSVAAICCCAALYGAALYSAFCARVRVTNSLTWMCARIHDGQRVIELLLIM